MEPGFLPVVFPVKFYGDVRRSSWHWYGVKFTDAAKWLKPHVGKNVTCRTSLIDGDGGVIAVDTWEIETLGLGGMRYWEEGENGFQLQGVIIAPAAIPRNDTKWLIPKFSFERMFLLADKEVRKLKKVSVELE